MDLTKLSTTQAANAIKGGEITLVAVTRALLDRIEEREGDVCARESIDPDAAPATAKVLDDTPPKGLIHGVAG